MDNDLNAEMAICNPIEKVKLNKKLKGNKSDEQYTLDLKGRLIEIEREEKRQDAKKSKRNFGNDEGTSLFTSPKKQKQPVSEARDYVYDSPVRGYAYGTPGGKKKSKKSKKSKKTKKAKKQTRKKKQKKN